MPAQQLAFQLIVWVKLIPAPGHESRLPPSTAALRRARRDHAGPEERAALAAVGLGELGRVDENPHG